MLSHTLPFQVLDNLSCLAEFGLDISARMGGGSPAVDFQIPRVLDPCIRRPLWGISRKSLLSLEVGIGISYTKLLGCWGRVKKRTALRLNPNMLAL